MRILKSLILFYPLFYSPVYAATEKVCPHITIVDGKLELNANERILVCGASEGAWESVPVEQSIILLRNIALNLGYRNPQFETTDDSLEITLGERTEIQSLEIQGAEEILNPDKKRKAVKEPLTSEVLNEIETWANLQVQSNGHACTTVDVSAQLWDGVVLVKTNLDTPKVFGKLVSDDLDGLDPRILERYQPFEVGDPYDIRKKQIMVSRILSDGLIESAYFTTDCVGNEANLELHTSVGKPHILRFSVGASTEEFPFVDVSYRDTRLDDQASSYLANLHLSPRLLSVSINSTFFRFPTSKKAYLGPRFVASKESEESYATYSAKAGIDIGRKWDAWNVRWDTRIGPTYNYTNTIRGIGPTDETYPSLDGSVSLMSHGYEFTIAEQSRGWISQFDYRGRSSDIDADSSLSRYELSFKHLWNIGNYFPPLFVLGTRIETTAVDVSVPNTSSHANAIPTDDKVYLGGDENLRGFSRQQIDNNGLGYLTSAYLGFELRLVEELPFKLQPFLLYDIAKVGNRNFTLEDTLYTSSGLGIRWASPFGTLRGSIAKGNIYNIDPESVLYPEEWVVFFSFGQEF